MNELVSLIIPVYNVRDYLEKCISSVIKQTYSNIEVLLIDDGSTDDSGAICDKYASEDSRLHVVHKENGGLSSARNKGLELAKGEYVCFIDSDDWVEEDYVEKLLTYAVNNDCDIVCCGMYIADESGNNSIAHQYNNALYEKDEALKNLRDYKLTDYAYDKIYRRSLWNDIQYPINMLCEDMGTTFKAFSVATKIGTIEDALYYYLQRNTSIVHTKNPKRVKDTFMMFNDRYEFFTEYFNEKNPKSEKELVKLAYYACTSSKKDDKDLAITKARNVILTHNVTPDISIKGKIKFFLYRMLLRTKGI